jgi:molecular chaperone GrpE
MIEDREGPAGAGPTEAPANDAGGDPEARFGDDAAEEGVPVSPEARLAAVEAELAETKDRLLRALAETENVRRRLQRERDDAQKYAVGGFAKELLSVVDNLQRALGAMPEADIKDARTRSLREGVAATERELLAAFERHGLQRIDPKGEPFDHNFHQAIFEVERPDVAAGTVVEVLQPGYLLHDRLLRPAMVGVAKGGGRSEDGTAGGSDTAA